MATWQENILERAAAILPGSTPDILVGEFDFLLADFLGNARAWRRQIFNASTTNHILELSGYVLDARVVGVIGYIGHGRRPIYPVTDIRMAKTVVSPGANPLYYTTLPSTKDKLEFFPTPSEELEDLTAEVFLAQKTGQYADVPEGVCVDFSEALLAGLCGRLQMMPKRTYTDPKLGALNLKEYRQGVNKARITANKARTSAVEAWRFPGFN